MILLVCCLYSFLGNAALQGPSPYLNLFSEIFGVTSSKASKLVTYPNLVYGFGSLILVPMYMKFGRRPIMLVSMLIVGRTQSKRYRRRTMLTQSKFIIGLMASCIADTYGGLMAARIIMCFGSGVCEAIPVQLVNDIFFLHERGKYLGYYTCETPGRRPILQMTVLT